jgi:hypothetical protein
MLKSVEESPRPYLVKASKYVPRPHSWRTMAPQVDMSNIPHHQIPYIVVGIMLVGLLAFRKGREWLKGRFRTFDFLPEYFEAMRLQFSDVFWGVGVGAGVPYIIYAIYSQFASPTPLVNWVAIIGAVFLAGYYLWRADHVRLQKKIEVTNVRTHSWTHRGGGTQYYFGVINKSEAETIHDVRVQLMEIIPEIENHDWLPIPLHLQHDNPLSGVLTQSFDLHPREPRNIDLFTTSNSTGNRIAQVAPSVSEVQLFVPISERCRFRVMVNAEHVPVLYAWFAAWIDEGGVFKCEME